MIKYMLRYKGKLMHSILFKSQDEAEDFAMTGFENVIEALCTWASSTKYQRELEKQLDLYFHYEIVKCKIEVL